MRLAPEGWIFILPWLVLAALLALFGAVGWGAGFLLVGVAVALFFRDPSRSFEGAERVLVAPADGKVLAVDEIDADFAPSGRALRVATFLSVFDVHVQRSPTAGQVVESRYRPGSKVAAFRADADRVNEQHLTLLRGDSGELVGVVQIAGLLARRVVAYLERGERVERGGHLGLIKFGSRVDLLVPPGYIIEVRPGDRVWAGRTPIARPPDETPID